MSEEPARIDPGSPGASARREHERRKARRQQRVRAKHPRLAAVLLALAEDPQSTRSWQDGARGEEAVGARLNELMSDRLRVLHDRRVPGRRANIDHLAVTPSGVLVIDTKNYKGRPRLKVEGGLLRPRVERMFVGSRDRTPLVDGVLAQVEVVRGVVGHDVPVNGVLCFVGADWPLVGGTFSTRGVEAVWPRKLVRRLQVGGPMGRETIAKLHRLLASALPPA